ncbi:hypothetical protein [Enhygromyxa salina]|uniref:Uncharacterized protein n=1 Tax=Enhygromyxa salina TaxID=215803 RepID=A0A2S9YKC8_9BACT|nr:hypothetical protein [Enhygromyxa salina]PRQ05565.1 hypothetical protein ENSA7_44550 [Enhygromyxa salina]
MAAAAIVLVCSHCTELPTEVGEHVIYHWDDSEARLCGGTVPTVDRFLEAVGGYYGWSPDDLGPGVEYFWDEELALSACSWLGASGCESRVLVRPHVFSKHPVDTHELAHATRGGHGRPALRYPAFINEAFASRWGSSVIEINVPFLTWPEFLSTAELRAALEVNDATKLDYGLAFTWWVALESTYGPAKMADFILELDGATTADDVERATRRVFGISLAESAALAESLPEASIDDPVCELDALPTYTWTGLPLVLERADADCDDGDIVNLHGDYASWMFALEFPDTLSPFYVSLSVPDGVDPISKAIFLVPCDGVLEFENKVPYYAAGVDDGGDSGTLTWPWRLRGRQVGRLAAEIEPDGAVVLPRVVFERVLDDADRPMSPE